MQKQKIEYYIKQKKEKREKMFKGIYFSDRNKKIEINKKYYNGEHWINTDSGGGNKTTSGKYIFGDSKKPQREDDKLQRSNGGKTMFSYGQLKVRNFVKFFTQTLEDSIIGSENQKITIKTNDSKQDSFLSELWDDNIETFIKTQLVKMIVTTVAVGKVIEEDGKIYIEKIDAKEIVPVYQRNKIVGYIRSIPLSKEDVKIQFNKEVKKENNIYTEIYLTIEDNIIFYKYINGEIIEKSNALNLEEVEERNILPYAIVENKTHPDHNFDYKHLAESEIFEIIEQNDTYNAQESIENLANLFLAIPKVSIDWNVAQKLEIDVKSSSFKRALNEFEFLPNNIDTLPIEVHKGEGIPESFYKNKQNVKKSIFEDAKIPYNIVSGDIPANISVETLELSMNILKNQLKQKRDKLVLLIKELSKIALQYNGDSVDINDIEVNLPSLETLSLKDMLTFYQEGNDRGWLPDNYAIEQSLKTIGKSEDIDKVISSKSENERAVQKQIEEEKNRLTKADLLDEQNR